MVALLAVAAQILFTATPCAARPAEPRQSMSLPDDGGTSDCTMPAPMGGGPSTSLKAALNGKDSFGNTIEVGAEMRAGNSTSCDSECQSCWSIAGGGYMKATIQGQIVGGGFKFGGGVDTCQTPTCVTPPTRSCTDPTCQGIRGQAAVNVIRGFEFNPCGSAWTAWLCKVATFKGTLTAGLGGNVMGTRTSGAPAGGCSFSCCPNGNDQYQLTAGPIVGAKGEIAADLNFGLLVKVKASMQVVACVLGNLGAGNDCDNNVVPAGDVSGFLQMCLQPDAVSFGGGTGTVRITSGNKVQICVPFGFFTTCFSVPACPIPPTGDRAQSCPSGL